MNQIRPLYISTGKVAEGKRRYYPRKDIERKIWRKIRQGENILLAAPRRTGKSSILKHIEKHPEQGFIVKYKAVQSIDSINEFFKHLYILLLEDDLVFKHYQRYLKKAAGSLKKLISKIRAIHLEGIEISPDEKIDYYHEFKTLLKLLPKDIGTIVLLIDEFPDAVKNIATDIPTGVRFLQLNRDLRQSESNANIQFIYTGSIGLGNVVNRLGRPDLINDISNIKVAPLTIEEGKDLIQCLLMGLDQHDEALVLPENTIAHILTKDSWLIPYYIQIIIDELCDIPQASATAINEAMVDKVIEKIITDRYSYQDYFENWKTRLRQALDSNEYRFALTVLNYISIKGIADSDQLHDTAMAHQIPDFKSIISILEYDGYISRNPKNQYRFNSIILKEWWYINVAT